MASSIGWPGLSGTDLLGDRPAFGKFRYNRKDRGADLSWRRLKAQHAQVDDDLEGPDRAGDADRQGDDVVDFGALARDLARPLAGLAGLAFGGRLLVNGVTFARPAAN
ncbi:MAG: hypothetical protein JF570_01270 [Caulobacter sp.]|nr:hypothetical protein [Caulobacter sp.]